MTDTTFLLRDPTEILRQDHDRMRELFARCERVDRSETERKRDLFQDLREEISVHSWIEETLFYPAVLAMDAARVREAFADHRAFRRLLEELAKMDVGDEGFDAKLRALGESVDRHSRLEEAEIFPLAMTLPKKTLHELSANIGRLHDRSTADDPPREIPFYPTLGMPDDAPPARDNRARGYENWGSE